MLKVINIVGARPNFMKIAPIVEAMKRREREWSSVVGRISFKGVLNWHVE